MTHTLETTGIARVVARALRLNEDLVEAIGLGHDMGHTPFGHAGEEALDAALQERFGRSFRHNEQSLRIAESLNLTRGGSRRDPHAHRRAGAGDARRQDRADRRPGRLHQPRHRRRDALRDPRSGASCLARRLRSSATGARGGSTRSCTTSSRPPSAQATSCRATRSATRCSRCARSCSSGCTSARRRASRAGARPGNRAADLRASRRARGRAGARSSSSSPGMTDRFALSYVEELTDGPDQGHIRRGGQGRGRHRRGRRGAHAAAQGRRPLHGPLPVPRGADAELLGQRRRQALLLLRLRGEGRPDHVRPGDASSSTSPARSSGSPTASTSRSSTRRPRRSRTRAAAGASVCSSCSRRPPSFYERYLWDSQAGSLARDYLAGRGLGEEICREYRLGLALGGTTLTRKALEQRLHARGTACRRPGEQARQRLLLGRLLFPLADARGRVLGFQARKLREDDPLQGEVRQLARRRAVPQGRSALRARPRRGPRSRSRIARSSSKGTPT